MRVHFCLIPGLGRKRRNNLKILFEPLGVLLASLFIAGCVRGEIPVQASFEVEGMDIRGGML